MKVTLAKHAGFCMGVKKAMNMALEASESSTERIYTLGPLVHNNDAVNMLKESDVYPAKDTDELRGKKVFIRAHGVPDKVKQDLIQKDNTIIDATCPNVVLVQQITKEYSAKGYDIVIVGDHGHAEVEGLLSYCEGKGHVISDKSEVASLPKMAKVCVIAQTTQSMENFSETTKEIEKLFKEVVVKSTICGATSIRQKEVLELAEHVDLVIVVGGRHSANTRRLEELSFSTGTPTILIENASQLDENVVKKYNHIGVTAGASTPSWVIDDVAKKIESIKVGSFAIFLRSIINYLHLFIDTSIYLGIGAVALYYCIAYFLGVPAFSDVRLPVIIYLFINSVHFLNSFYIERTRRAEKGQIPFFSLEKSGFIIAMLYLFISIILSSFLHWFVFIIHLILCVSGIIYSKIKFPKNISNIIKFKSLRDIPASKDVFQSLAWVIIIVGYPAIYNGLDLLHPKILVAAFFVGCIVFARSIVYDMKEIRLDKLVGKETLPILLGKKNTKILLVMLLSILMGGLLYIKANYLHYIKINIFLYSLLYMITYLYLFHKRIVYKGYLLNLIIDGQFLFAGVITWLFYVK
jgi:4-hydroxy-3-methylbut-2-enyl diphosphate reductase